MTEQAEPSQGRCAVCGQRVDLVPKDYRLQVLRGMVAYHRPLVWKLNDPHEWCQGSGQPSASD